LAKSGGDTWFAVLAGTYWGKKFPELQGLVCPVVGVVGPVDKQGKSTPDRVLVRLSVVSPIPTPGEGLLVTFSLKDIDQLIPPAKPIT